MLAAVCCIVVVVPIVVVDCRCALSVVVVWLRVLDYGDGCC